MRRRYGVCWSTKLVAELSLLICALGNSWAERIRSGGVGKKALEMNLATKTELEEMAKAWEEWAVTEDACFGCLHGEILVRK